MLRVSFYFLVVLLKKKKLDITFLNTCFCIDIIVVENVGMANNIEYLKPTTRWKEQIGQQEIGVCKCFFFAYKESKKSSGLSSWWSEIYFFQKLKAIMDYCNSLFFLSVERTLSICFSFRTKCILIVHCFSDYCNFDLIWNYLFWLDWKWLHAQQQKRIVHRDFNSYAKVTF